MFNARLWVYINDDFVKLTLSPKQGLTWSKAWRTEEGYASISETFEFDGQEVWHRTDRDGRDCDGRLSTREDETCSLESLQARPVPCFDTHRNMCISLPEWITGSGSVYDEYAQAANY
jgi:hypothetical protein